MGTDSVKYSGKNFPPVLKVALVGNPNSGKSTLFNALTGLNQKTGNFPGVTVDKKTGFSKIGNAQNREAITVEYIDLPGTYSLYPKSSDEKITYEVLCKPGTNSFPDITIVVADASNLKRSLLLASQIIDLKNPVVLALNMMDMADKKGISINAALLSKKLGIQVIPINARNKEGIEELKQAIIGTHSIPAANFIDARNLAPALIDEIKTAHSLSNDYDALRLANNIEDKATADLLEKSGIDKNKLQALESIERYKIIHTLVEECVTQKEQAIGDTFSNKLDRVLTHKVGGYLIFIGVLFLIFQSIFFLAAYPMSWIESSFVWLSEWGTTVLPKGELTDLFINGILAGMSGIFIFVPQIALLFAAITILEDTGYMARVSFIMDKLMRKFGLNGRSVIPLISGVACAVPAIMSSRTITNRKERIITIMVTPLISCSARLPVYTLLIALVMPSDKALGFFNLQGMALMGLYLIGFVAAVGVAWVMKHILKTKEKSYFIMEMPVYRMPKWSTIGITIVDKVKIFLFDAGKIIIAISIVLWVLSSHAPGDTFDRIEQKYHTKETQKPGKEDVFQTQMATEKLEASYAGMLGKVIEPVIAPLGFDWKIGISLVTSFAAREVFVGTMATIYSVGGDDSQSVREKMMSEVDQETGKPRYTLAVGLSLMLFYVFAMQCMSTLAVVYRETKEWKWPFIQFLYMGFLAYISSFLVYHLLG